MISQTSPSEEPLKMPEEQKSKDRQQFVSDVAQEVLLKSTESVPATTAVTVSIRPVVPKKLGALRAKLKRHTQRGDVQRQASQEVLKTWRSYEIPEIEYQPLSVDLVGIPDVDRSRVEKACKMQYASANRLFERSIGRACLRYVWKDGQVSSPDPGPLLEFSRRYSRRYLDLYRYVVRFEMQEGVPLIPNAAGQLKNYGFTSEEICALQPISQDFLKLIEGIESAFLSGADNEESAQKDFSLFMKMLTSPEGRSVIENSIPEFLAEISEEFRSRPSLPSLPASESAAKQELNVLLEDLLHLDREEFYKKYAANLKALVVKHRYEKLVMRRKFLDDYLRLSHPAFSKLSSEIKARFHDRFPDAKEAERQYAQFMAELTNSETQAFKTKYKHDSEALEWLNRYQSHPMDYRAIDRVFFMMLTFGRVEVSCVLSQLEDVASSAMRRAALTADHFLPLRTRSGPLTLAEGSLLLESVGELQILLEDCKRYFVGKDDQLSEFITLMLTNPETFSGIHGSEELQELIRRFNTLPNRDLLREVLQIAFKDLPPIAQIRTLLRAVSSLPETLQGLEEERLLMEIRHRIGGDGSWFQTAPGSVGQNPLAYINAVVEGEKSPKLYESEFRQQMFFVYMSNHFANSVMGNKKLVDFVNGELAREGKDWRLDPRFIDVLSSQGPSHLAPIFRYGSGAQLNRLLRDARSHASPPSGMVTFGELKTFARNRERGLSAGALNKDFCYLFSQRELLNQFGVLNPEDVPDDAQVRFTNGEQAFYLRPLQEVAGSAGPKLDAARKYVQMTMDLCIPTAAGISGTLDQSIAMAGLIGIGTHEDQSVRMEELQTIKRAFLAFMVPNTDHSTFEVLFSAMSTYGLSCRFGPGFEHDICPGDRRFEEVLDEEVKRTAGEFPSFYLTNGYARDVHTRMST